MAAGSESPSNARRNRVIAIAASAITVLAIVLAFASGYLGQEWLWLRPAGELLLLAELVGLIVLERHQLFEPVHQTVGDIKFDTAELRAALATITQQIGSAGQTTVYPTSHELLRNLTRLLRDSFSRDQEAPQILRMGRFAGEPKALVSDPEYAAEFDALNAAILEGMLSSGSSADAKARWWSIRILGTVWNRDQFDFIMERLVKDMIDRKPLNFELKLLVRPGSDYASLSPIITDQEALVTFDDDRAMFQWGIVFHGRQYTTLLARWFDEAWSRTSDHDSVYSRSGLNQAAVDRIRTELEALATMREGTNR